MTGPAIPGVRYAHTNLIAREAETLIAFYVDVFGCEVASRRDLGGDWLARGTAVPGARLSGAHLRLPGHGPKGPTLEIFTYEAGLERPTAMPNHLGYGHLAFQVDDVRAAVERVLAAGGARLGEVVEHDVPGAGHLTFTYVRDPEGNIVELQSWESGDSGSAPG